CMSADSTSLTFAVLPSWPMRLREVLAALHLLEPAARPCEIMHELFAAIEVARADGGRQNQLHAPVVELVDERDEAPCLVLEVHGELRHVRDEHRVIQARQLDVVVLAPRAVANLREIEPDHALGRAPVADRPA